MNPFYLTVLSFTVLFLLHRSLKAVFWLIEKAHERPRKPRPRNSGVQPMRERSA